LRWIKSGKHEFISGEVLTGLEASQIKSNQIKSNQIKPNIYLLQQQDTHYKYGYAALFIYCNMIGYLIGFGYGMGGVGNAMSLGFTRSVHVWINEIEYLHYSIS
jgi:hypothetical protein